MSALIDGGNNVGMLAIYYAAQDAIKRAKRHGIAIVCMSNAWMSGRSAHFCEMIAREGLIGIHTVASDPRVTPFGGSKATLGTNPIAFGFPTEGEPLVIDMGTSAFMATDLQFRERLGTPIPDGVALDPDGRPTTDAGDALRGALLPFGGPDGGYKGFGLALATDAIGSLCATARALGDTRGYLIIAFKPDLFLPLDDYRRDLSRRIAAIKASPRQDGVNEIRILGAGLPHTRAHAARRVGGGPARTSSWRPAHLSARVECLTIGTAPAPAGERAWDGARRAAAGAAARCMPAGTSRTGAHPMRSMR